MSIKDLLVHLDDSPRSEQRITIACDLAQRFSARLAGLYVADAPMPQRDGELAGNGAATAPNGAETGPAGAAGEARRTADDFLASAANAGVTAEWRLDTGAAADIVAEHALYADLAIVGQKVGESPASSHLQKVPETVLLSTGRPVMVIPYTGDFPTVGHRILIAWKPCREAARAVNDAWPLLAQAERVTILTVNQAADERQGKDSATRIAEHLARHGVRAAVERVTMSDIPDATVLLNSASDMGADLIVAGGYGRSPFREMVFGGTTRSLLNEMVAPVMLSH
jgi:nucleotide-binding universal stress UspA family protein